MLHAPFFIDAQLGPIDRFQHIEILEAVDDEMIDLRNAIAGKDDLQVVQNQVRLRRLQTDIEQVGRVVIAPRAFVQRAELVEDHLPLVGCDLRLLQQRLERGAFFPTDSPRP